jgi:glycosyltransferase involved in cell wall biosynthesis
MPSGTPIRIVRVIARLNIGGPAIQAITLTKRLEDWGYRTRLVRGSEGPAEGDMDYLARELGVIPTLVASMRRDPGPGDVAALGALVRIMRSDRPHIVHTHAAKAGTLGRLAALLAFPQPSERPRLVHTFHGHSLTGYFGGPTAAFYRGVERALARKTDALVAVSGEVADDLARLGVARRERFTVVPLGFDLTPFVDDGDRDARRRRLRQELGIPADAELVTLVARLVPIKRVDRFLRVARLVAENRPRAQFLVVGGGELQDSLRASEDAHLLGDRVRWAGFRRDLPDVCFASDVVVLTSDNEGTPVSLIEAQAAAVPVVGTDVGGVRGAVRDGETGLLADPADEIELAGAIDSILDRPETAGDFARAGRDHAVRTFGIERLVEELDGLYRKLVTDRQLDTASR